VPLRSNVPKVDEAKEPNKIFQPFQISGENLVQSGEQTFELSNNPEFKLCLQNPQEALSKAYRLKPNDISVLNRLGRSLWNRSLAMKNCNDMDRQLKYLENANKILSASIKVDSDMPCLTLLEDFVNTV
jgi:hypothetical protein